MLLFEEDFATTRSTIVPSQIEYDCIVGRMLGKVREVILSCDPEDDSENMVFIKSFALLLSIKKLSCWNMGEGSSQSPFRDCHLPLQASNISDLTFDSCETISARLFEFLEGVKTLRRFTYLNPKHYFDPFWIWAALVAHARHSLERLMIHGADREQNPGPMGSLRLFERLRTIETDIHFLVVAKPDADHSVADTLPRALEDLILSGDALKTISGIRRYVLALMEAKQIGRLPCLKKVQYNLQWDFMKEGLGFKDFTDLYESCEKNGVDFTIFLHSDPLSLPIQYKDAYIPASLLRRQQQLTLTESPSEAFSVSFPSSQ